MRGSLPPAARGVVIAALATALLGCTAVPSTGPLTSDIIVAAADTKSDLVYDVVDVSYSVAKSVADYRPAELNRRFGPGDRGGVAVIGPGDVLEVTIFEAGADGLFSTTESKATSLTVVVQQNGSASIPYVGPVRFAGRTVESARRAIVEALREKAIEPDVLVNISKNVSRTVSVGGSVNTPGVIPLNPGGNQITEIIALAGGASQAPYDTYVSVTRHGITARVRLQSILDNPAENIFVRPNDQIYLTFDPQVFTVLGETSKVGKVRFESETLSLAEAGALAGGGDRNYADPKGYFVFRFELPEIYELIVGKQRFAELLQHGMKPDREGRYPIVYRIDMSRPQSLLSGQVFPINNHDLVYISRHPSTDFQRFIALIAAPVGLAATIAARF